MRSTEAFSLLKTNLQPFFTTREASAMLGLSLSYTTELLQGLTRDGLIRRIEQGHWAIDPKATPLAYASWVAMPLPSYVSLYTALFHYGIIQQIPRTIYVISLAKTEVVQTDLGEYSVHQIAPALFRGYVDRNGIRIATMEKAVFDTLYLSRASSGKFTELTEIDLPPEFDRDELLSYLNLITDTSSGVHRHTSNAIQAFLSKNSQ
jgi:predicted transcriptional regulator of viral defense system